MLRLRNAQDLKEKFIVSGVFIGLFLPVRILFYTYVSSYWLGSLGLISILAFTMTYLAHKDKLGAFGRIWKKQLSKIAKGKLGTISIFTAIFTLSFYMFSLYSFNMGQDMEAYQIVINILDEENLNLSMDMGRNFEIINDANNNMDIIDTLENAFDGANILVNSTPEQALYSVILAMAILDAWSGGWFQHFYIVFFVEEIERLGITLYFRYRYKPKKDN